VQKSIRQLHRELRSKQDYVAQAQRLGPTIAETEARLQEANAFTASWQERAPGTAGLSGFYAGVIDAAQEAGVKTVRFDPGSPEPLKTLQKQPLEMEIEGTFAGVFQFSSRLERLAAPVWLEEINIEPRSEDRENLQCEIKMAVFAARTENSD
jgi:Tfp pilus assembly protein PilO